MLVHEAILPIADPQVPRDLIASDRLGVIQRNKHDSRFDALQRLFVGRRCFQQIEPSFRPDVSIFCRQCTDRVGIGFRSGRVDNSLELSEARGINTTAETRAAEALTLEDRLR